MCDVFKKSPFTDLGYLLYTSAMHVMMYIGCITRMADKLKIWTRFECTLSRQMNNSTRSVQCWRLYYNTCGYLPSGMLSFSKCTDADVHNDHRRAVLRFGYIKCRSYHAVQFMHENTRDHQVTKLRSRGVGKLLLNGNKTTHVYITRYNKGRLNTLFSKYVHITFPTNKSRELIRYSIFGILLLTNSLC